MTTDTTTTTTDTEYLTQRAAEMRKRSAEAAAWGEHQFSAVYLACAESHEASLAARAADARGDHDAADAHRQTAAQAAARSLRLVEAL